MIVFRIGDLIAGRESPMGETVRPIAQDIEAALSRRLRGRERQRCDEASRLQYAGLGQIGR